MDSTTGRARLRKAGDTLRRHQRAGTLAQSLTDPRVVDALDAAEAHRDAHTPALETVGAVLRSIIIEIAGPGHPVVDRQKRVDRIVEKMARLGSGFDRLQDIAGLRVVLPGRAAVQAVARRIDEELEIVTVDDYSLAPKSTGYRSLHIIVEHEGYPVEVQLRTPAEQRWADAVEGTEATTGFPLKDADGPREVLEYFRVAAELLALEESGAPVDTELVAQLDDLRERATPFLRQSGTPS